MKSIKYVMVTLAILTISAFIPAIAYASKPETVTADFTFEVTVHGARTSGTNTILDVTDLITFTDGALVGTTICDTGTFIIHNADGTGNFNFKCIFTGTILGYGSGEGTLAVSFQGQSVGDSYVATEIFGSGTGGLAGIHGQTSAVGGFTSDTTGFGTKTINLQIN